jgi:hypothetical protein
MSDTDDLSDGEMLRLQSFTAPDPQTRFNIDCNRVFLDGSRQFEDFETSMDALKSAGVTGPDVLSQVLDVDNPAKLLHTLAQDMDLAKQVAALPPVKRAAAIAAIDRGDPIPNTKSQPAWRAPPSQRTEDSLSDSEWARANAAGKIRRGRDR